MKLRIFSVTLLFFCLFTPSVKAEDTPLYCGKANHILVAQINPYIDFSPITTDDLPEPTRSKFNKLFPQSCPGFLQIGRSTYAIIAKQKANTSENKVLLTAGYVACDCHGPYGIHKLYEFQNEGNFLFPVQNGVYRDNKSLEYFEVKPRKPKDEYNNYFGVQVSYDKALLFTRRSKLPVHSVDFPLIAETP